MGGPVPLEGVLGQGRRLVQGSPHRPSKAWPYTTTGLTAPRVGCRAGPSDLGCASHMAWSADMQSRQGCHCAAPRRPVSLKIGHQIQIQILDPPLKLPLLGPPTPRGSPAAGRLRGGVVSKLRGQPPVGCSWPHRKQGFPAHETPGSIAGTCGIPGSWPGDYSPMAHPTACLQQLIFVICFFFGALHPSTQCMCVFLE